MASNVLPATVAERAWRGLFSRESMVMAYFGMLVSRFGLFHGWNEGKGAQKLHHHNDGGSTRFLCVGISRWLIGTI